MSGYEGTLVVGNVVGLGTQTEDPAQHVQA